MTDSITQHDSMLAALPLGVEVRHLAALEAIAATSSFSQAAQLLGYAQSAVSQQIATLERAVGHKLVERPGGPRPVSLTAAGEVLLLHATHITARLGAAKADLDALAAGNIGSLRVGTFQSASARLLPPTLNRFRQEFPHVTVELRNEQSAVELDELVRAGQLDLAFTEGDTHLPPLASAPMIADPYVVIVAPDNPIAAASSIRLVDLHEAHIIAGSAMSSCESIILGAVERAGAKPLTVFRSDDNLTTQRLVAAGLGVAIAPLLAIELLVADAAVAVIPVADAELSTRSISIVWHQDRYRSRAAQAFVDTAAEVAANIAMPNIPLVTSAPAPSLYV
ncbi:MAG TPA: LysR family transcriptional regulator [Ilumatobacteraceae bacterium]|nr:LysR family transcriptional regulator [Ilumatobacteraceae bacterium]